MVVWRQPELGGLLIALVAGSGKSRNLCLSKCFEASISLAISLIGAELVLPPANLFLACRCGGNFKGQSHFGGFFVCFFRIKVISGLTHSFIMLVGMRIRHNHSQGDELVRPWLFDDSWHTSNGMVQTKCEKDNLISFPSAGRDRQFIVPLEICLHSLVSINTKHMPYTKKTKTKNVKVSIMVN